MTTQTDTINPATIWSSWEPHTWEELMRVRVDRLYKALRNAEAKVGKRLVWEPRDGVAVLVVREET